MQKHSFLTITTIFLATITMPSICMELAQNNTKKEQFILELHLQKAQRNLNEVQTMNDRYHCNLLGINWEENNNSYSVESHLFVAKESLTHQMFPGVCTEQIKQQFNITIPNSLPNSFVERLKKDKTITLENDLPIQIIVHLKGTHSNPDDTTNTSFNTNNQNTIDNNMRAKIDVLLNTSDDSEQPQTNSKFKTYIIPAAGFTAIGIIAAWLMYLHQNNQLDAQFSHIANFIRNLINNKNS